MKIRRRCGVAAMVAFTAGVLLQGCEDGILKVRSPRSAAVKANEDATGTPSVDMDAVAPNCAEPPYAGWKCLSRSVRSAESLNYAVTFRWNRVGKVSAGSTVWVLGSNGRGSFRGFPGGQGASVQDQLDVLDSIRSIEIEFTDPPVSGIDTSGGYWKFLRGYRSAASAYMAALEFVVQSGISKGSFLNHIGGSNGTMVAAYAISNLQAGRFLNRVIFHAGPFLSDLSAACTPGYWAGFDRSPQQFATIKDLVNYWSTGQRTTDVCTAGVERSVSVLRFGTKRFPNLGIHVVMGQLEESQGFGPWMLDSNLEWFHSIEAAEKTRMVRSDIGHEMGWSDIRALESGRVWGCPWSRDGRGVCLLGGTFAGSEL